MTGLLNICSYMKVQIEIDTYVCVYVYSFEYILLKFYYLSSPISPNNTFEHRGANESYVIWHIKATDKFPGLHFNCLTDN